MDVGARVEEEGRRHAWTAHVRKREEAKDRQLQDARAAGEQVSRCTRLALRPHERSLPERQLLFLLLLLLLLSPCETSIV